MIIGMIGWYILGLLSCAWLLKEHRKYKSITISDIIFAITLSWIGPLVLLLAAILTRDSWMHKTVIKRKT